MNAHEEEEIKKEFQLERVILFSDAVFAIIITIMVIDIKLPENMRELTEEHVRHSFFELIPKLLAYALSFFLVATFWMRHLKIFSFLRDYNKMVLVYNLLFLFVVSLFPFGVSMISGLISLKSAAYGWSVNIYIGIVLLTFFAQTLLTRYLVKHKAELCYNNKDMERVLQWKSQRINLFVTPVIAAAVCVCNYINLSPTISMYCVGTLGIVNGFARKAYYPDQDAKISFFKRIFRKQTSKKPAAKSKKTKEDLTEDN
ncbi:TMEM175 family protein [Mucilaginibacter agri]|uniref:DUF1211 domain-containing protein n=1 Tax=Mucilaginibacter agri TaxID=2695265 RepID=A0A966DS08_9SPHI|nr:TMEM175 family protein [Mucilaginibacter agri]NCD69070.1 DUF1211 domain-containing protein [Mucilaginibacter agri]